MRFQGLQKPCQYMSFCLKFRFLIKFWNFNVLARVFENFRIVFFLSWTSLRMQSMVLIPFFSSFFSLILDFFYNWDCVQNLKHYVAHVTKPMKKIFRMHKMLIKYTWFSCMIKWEMLQIALEYNLTLPLKYKVKSAIFLVKKGNNFAWGVFWQNDQL